jgi:hypothetical protein
VIVPLKPGGADRPRAKLAAAPEARIEASDRIGTVHDMRFVFIDNDTRLLFCTAYDGDWAPYIYCAHPDATVRDIWRSQKIAKALDGLPDASQP